MSTIVETIEVEVPVRTAYDQWTQFESFPRFMDHVERIEQLDDKRLHWVAEIGGRRHEWDAEITEQEPDQRIAWRDEAGKTNAGVVTFHRLGEGQTRIAVQMDWQPEGLGEQVAEAFNFDDRALRNDLQRFKQFIESREEETGAWRGEVDQTTS